VEVQTSEQPPDPAVSAPVQEETPSLTATDPVGVPRPAGEDCTVKFTVTGCPATDGSGATDVMLVVEPAGNTVTNLLLSGPVLLKFALPG
jgi:hypothetical protein